MHESGRLQRVTGALLAEVVMSKAPQLTINEGQKCLERLAVPASPLTEYFANLLGRSWAHFALRATHQCGELSGG